MSRIVLLVQFSLLLASAGCGKELTAGGRQQVEVVATDRGPGAPAAAWVPQPAMARDPGPGAAWLRPDEAAASAPGSGAASHFLQLLLDGTVQVRASAALLHESGELVQISPTPTTATLDIGAAGTASLGRNSVRTGRYVRLVLAFHEATAQVGTGSLFTTVTVAIGAQPLVVERDLQLDVDRAAARVVEVDLNTSTWAALAVGGVVPPELFAAALRISVR
jgi:hypothetical protein